MFAWCAKAVRHNTGVSPCLAAIAALLIAWPSVGLAQSPVKWRFAVVGDTHVPDSNLLADMVAAFVGDGVQLVVFPGDIVDGGLAASALTYEEQLKTWRNLVGPLYQAGIGVYPIRGNHENDARSSIDVWNSVFSGPYALPGNGPDGEVNLTYSFTHKNALFVGLDDYLNIHRVNQAWLDQQLSGNTTRPHVFVFGHEPAFKVFHTDMLDDFATDRNAFWTSLQRAGVNLYLCGHDHFFDLARIDDGNANTNPDLYQVVVGTGGGRLFDKYNYFAGSDNSNYTPIQFAHFMSNGYLLVELSGESNADLGVTLAFKQRTIATDGAISYGSAYSLTYSAAAKANGSGNNETRCAANACTTPSAAQASALFDSIEPLFAAYFPAGSATQTVRIGADEAHYRSYAGATGLGTYQGGLWYSLDGAWNRYSTLNAARTQFCPTGCW